MHRLFVALRPPAAMRQRLAMLAGGIAGARWQDDDQLHLTLRFVGEVDRHRAEDIAAALGAVRARAVTLAIDGVGRFGADPSPHSLWAGVAADPALEVLRRAIDRALVRVGIAPETRAFCPHVTVARLSRRAAAVDRGPIDRWLAEHAGLRIAPVTIDRFALFESRLGSAGASYEAIVPYPLG